LSPFARAQGGAPATTEAKKSAPKVKAPAAPAPTAAEISDATAKGLVWVNLNTKVYHKPGVATYGTTKNGKFMTEEEAQKGGFKAAQEPIMGKKPKKTATISTEAPK
jgi:hypothetical protein